MHRLYRLIDEDPRFHALQRSRSRFAWSLVALVLTGYYSFVSVIAFAPALFARALYEGTTISIGLLAALAVLLLSIGLTGLYIVRANRVFDRLNRTIVDDARSRFEHR
ncbi:MAG: DUF485 domain-containing protein [Gammaproteobacteria bacterium]|nr:DUF485 domain-containing protein [Gammaproteobacteria bacterium]